MEEEKYLKKITHKHGMYVEYIFEKYTEYRFTVTANFYNVLTKFNETMYRKSFSGKKPKNPSYDDVANVVGQFRWMFRGHWDSKWELIPSAFRNSECEWDVKFHSELRKWYKSYTKNLNILSGNSEEGKEAENNARYQIIAECLLLIKFMETANSLGIDCNYTSHLHGYEKKLRHVIGLKKLIPRELMVKWPAPSILPIMALAQHHGTPTRLLDFTYNPLFAAFFAASEPFFKKDSINKKDPETGSNICVWAISEKADMFNGTWQKIPTQQSNRSSNLFAQEGTLILYNTKNEGHLTDRWKWQDLQTGGTPEQLIKLTLPQRSYKVLLRQLLRDNITPARIMPNLDRVTQTLEYNNWLSIKKKSFVIKR